MAITNSITMEPEEISTALLGALATTALADQVVNDGFVITLTATIEKKFILWSVFGMAFVGFLALAKRR